MMKKYLLLSILPLAALAAFALPSTGADGESLRIVKFEADWCGPCQQMKPIFKKASDKFDSGVTFQTVNVDSNASLANRYNVERLPTVVAVKNGREVGRSTGFMNSWKLNAFIRKHQ